MHLSNKSRRRIGNTVGELGYNDKIKALIKKITDTHILQSTNNVFIYSPCKLGGLGITSAYDDYQVQNVVHASRLLMSKDEELKKFIAYDLTRVVTNRIHINDDPIDTALKWLNHEIDLTKTNYSDTWWSKTRTSIRTLSSKFHIKITFYREHCATLNLYFSI